MEKIGLSKTKNEIRNARIREKYANDPEFRARIIANTRKWRERNLEKARKQARDRARKCYRQNPQKFRKRAQDRYWKDPEAILIRQRKVQRKYNLKYHYGITYEQWAEMLKRQKYRCLICLFEFANKNNRDPVVDHCHKNKEVRGALCRKCNAALGAFKDDPKILNRAIKYLQRNK